jgi:hypothetical protein
MERVVKLKNESLDEHRAMSRLFDGFLCEVQFHALEDRHQPGFEITRRGSRERNEIPSRTIFMCGHSRRVEIVPDNLRLVPVGMTPLGRAAWNASHVCERDAGELRSIDGIVGSVVVVEVGSHLDVAERDIRNEIYIRRRDKAPAVIDEGPHETVEV